MGKLLLLVAITLLSFSRLIAQTIEPIPFGDMENWQKRIIKESGIIGGKCKTLFEISKGADILNNTPFINQSSNWATSSVMACVAGIYKGSITVFPDKRDDRGTAVRLETKLEEVKVLGIINISALATGSIFLGNINEPIRNTKNPLGKLMQGIPFCKYPSFIQFDYKFINGNNGNRIMNSGFSKKDIEGKNAAEMSLLLQHRWEDTEGNIYATRVATAWRRYPQNKAEWVNNERVGILYGDITEHLDFNPYMGLIHENPLYTKNSKGDIMPIIEVGWAPENEEPTHMILKFSSGYGGAYIGAPGSKMWVDNIALGYNN